MDAHPAPKYRAVGGRIEADRWAREGGFSVLALSPASNVEIALMHCKLSMALLTYVYTKEHTTYPGFYLVPRYRLVVIAEGVVVSGRSGRLCRFHELGHFLAARWVGVKVLKFSLGFGPKLFGRQMGETEYLVSAIPLGGYVKLFGEDEAEATTQEDRARSFAHKGLWGKVLIVAAGPGFNFILAYFIFPDGSRPERRFLSPRSTISPPISKQWFPALLPIPQASDRRSCQPSQRARHLHSN